MKKGIYILQAVLVLTVFSQTVFSAKSAPDIDSKSEAPASHTSSDVTLLSHL